MIDFCKKNNVWGSQFLCAQEMSCQIDDIFHIPCSAKRFETLCDLALFCWLKASDISVVQLCKAVAKLEADFVNGEGKDPTDINKWDIISEATWEEG